MKAIVLVISSLVSLDLLSQVNPCSLLRQYFLEAIGKRVSLDTNFKINDRIRINNYRSFTYLGCQNDSMNYGGVIFDRVNLFINKRNKIKVLSYSKSYSSADIVQLNEKFSEDFELITNHISSRYDVQCVKRGETSDERYSREAAVWEVDKHTIKLIKTLGQWRNKSDEYHYYIELEFW